MVFQVGIMRIYVCWGLRALWINVQRIAQVVIHWTLSGSFLFLSVRLSSANRGVGNEKSIWLEYNSVACLGFFLPFSSMSTSANNSMLIQFDCLLRTRPWGMGMFGLRAEWFVSRGSAVLICMKGWKWWPNFIEMKCLRCLILKNGTGGVLSKC